MISGVRNRSSGLFATVVSAIALLYATTRVFSQLQDALNAVWEVESKVRRNILQRLRRRFAAFLATIGAGALLFGVLVVEPSLRALLPRVTTYPMLSAGFEFVMAWAILTFAFAMIYRIMPNVKLTWGDVLLGGGRLGVVFHVGGVADVLVSEDQCDGFGLWRSWIVHRDHVLVLHLQPDSASRRGDHARLHDWPWIARPPRTIPSR
jgi:uncharacterized BrkB/YihY/UPF0761 family membrane protein